MNLPRDMDSAYYGPWGAGCLWVYFIFTSVGLLILAIYGKFGTLPEEIFAIGFLVIIFLVAPIVALLWVAKKYATWKKWAEERGWEEPPRKERAWKKGDS